MSRQHRRFVSIYARLSQLHPDLIDPTEAVLASRVLVNGAVVTNPDALVARDASVVVRPPRRLRGSAKLEAALARFELVIAGQTAVDVGAAAGGFTTVLLEAGARRVYAVDVGFGQLVGRLRQDPRVVVMERTSIADLNATRIPDTVDVVVIDVSHLPVAEAVPQLNRLRYASHADLIALIKPIYELRLGSLPVSPTDTLEDAVKHASRGIETAGWEPRDWVPSPVRGGRGASEGLLHATRTTRP